MIISSISNKNIKPSEAIKASDIRESLLSFIQKNHPEFSNEGYISYEELNFFRRLYITELVIQEKGELAKIDEDVVEAIRSNAVLSENIEEKKEKLRLKMFRGKIGDSISTYSAYTRQSCNFVFPNISDKINGELRPRPTITGLKDNEINTIIEGKNLTKQNTLIKTNKDVLEYIKQTKIFINTFIYTLI